VAPALAAARRAGVRRAAVAELGLMLYLYAGFPAAIEFLRALDANWPAPRARSVPAPASYADWRAWQARGSILCRRVYGAHYAVLRRFMARLHPDLDQWMIVEGYGKTLSRPGLTAVERELATVTALAVLGWERQLEAHRQGALHVGARAGEVAQAEALGRAAARSLPRAARGSRTAPAPRARRGAGR
jgi:4-carboxymuconolactone decarboxylase